jgi:WD40 repeat protein/serine/threonine protein kinase
MIVFPCPGCSRELRFPPEAAGTRVGCPHCGQAVGVPEAAAAGDAPTQVPTAPTRASAPGTVGAGAPQPPGHGGTAARPATAQLHELLGPAEAADEIGRLGHYRILKVLGTGGMGVVYHAEDMLLQRPVALKVMLPTLAASEAYRQRFLREARAAAAIEHDHIVPIYQVGEDRGLPYLAMPLLQGESLEDRLRRLPALPLAEVLRIGREMAEGLAAAHERGLVHRDVKPANVWLEGGRARVKILDFGLARPRGHSSQLTQHGTIVGTPAYMAPEQARAGAVDSRCDLFSLGCVLYRLCTGEPAFDGTGMVATLVAVAMDQPPPPHERNPHIPSAVSALVMRLLAKDPSHRPPSAQAVADELRSLEGHLAVPGRKTEPTVRAAPVQTPSYHRWLIAPVAGGVAVVVLALLRVLPTSPDTSKPTPNNDNAGIATTKPAAAAPLGPAALVGSPARLPGVRSWTLETRPHRGFALGAAFSPSGRRLASFGEDGVLRVWDKGTGDLLRVLLGHAADVHAAAWSPDGKLLASAGADTAVLVWDVGSGRLLQALRGHGGAVRALAWSPDGVRVASGGDDRTVRVWDASAGKMLAVFNRHTHPVEAVDWRDPATVVSTEHSAAARTAWVWEAATGRGLYSYTFTGPAAWSADRSTLTCRDGDAPAVLFWDATTGRVLRRLPLKGRKGPLGALAGSPDGRLLATAAGRAVEFWDAVSGKPRRRTRDGHAGALATLSFAPDGRRLASTGLHDDTVQLWAADADGPEQTLKGGANLRWAGWSPGGTAVLAGNGERIHCWHAADGTKAFDISGEVVGPTDVTWSRDGTTLAAACTETDKISLWDAKTGKFLRLVAHNPGAQRWLRAAWSPDGKALAIVENQGVRLWDYETGKAGAALVGHTDAVTAVLWSPDSRRVATAGLDGTVRLWQAATGACLRTLPARGRLAWSPDGRYIAQCDGNRLQAWDAQRDAAPREVGHGADERFSAVAWSADGTTLAAGSSRGRILLFQAEGGALVRSIANAHEEAVYTLAWLPDGKTLASAGDEGTAKWWDAAGKAVRACKGLPGRGRFSPDGTSFTSMNDRTGLRIWDTATGRLRGCLLFFGSAADGFLSVGADGRYRASPGVEPQLVVVVATDEGQRMMTLAEFGDAFGWKNDPGAVSLAR